MSDQRQRDVLREVVKDMPIKSAPYLKEEAEREQAYLEREAKREQMEERVEEIKGKIGRVCSAIAPIMFGVGVLLIIIGIFYVLVPFFLTGVTSGGTVFARHLSGGVLCLIISWLSWLIGEILE